MKIYILLLHKEKNDDTFLQSEIYEIYKNKKEAEEGLEHYQKSLRSDYTLKYYPELELVEEEL